MYSDSMLFMDAPDHTRLRSLVNRAFTPRSVEALRPRTSIARGLLDAVDHAPHVDLVEAFAAPFPTHVIAEMIGIDPAERRRFKAWADAIAMSFDPQPTAETHQAIVSAVEGMTEHFAATIAERR